MTPLRIPVLAIALIAGCAATDSHHTQPISEGRRKLEARTIELRQDIVKVSDNVYTAVGYTPANVSMVIGTDGIMIVDTGMSVIHAKPILAEFRKITDKPVAAIIYTHGHGDHTGGASVFAADAKPQIWARANLNEEGNKLASAGLTINGVRGRRQGGFALPPEKRINNGIAPAMRPSRKGNAFASTSNGFVPPNHTFDGDQQDLHIAGIHLQLVAAPGETGDELFVWLPDSRVLFSGDNFYASWPNLYAIRGVPYRDVKAWADSLDKMLQLQPDDLVPGHTRPILGQAGVTVALTDYRDAVRFVFDKTIEGMNKGLTPDELVEYVQLPERLAKKDYLQPYYGHIEWGVRSIFNGYLGWFDGNPTTLFPLRPREEAEHMAELAGGQAQLRQCARQALDKGDAQWAAQLADYLLTLDKTSNQAMELKADALEHLGEMQANALARNYYLTVAQELCEKADAQPK